MENQDVDMKALVSKVAQHFENYAPSAFAQLKEQVQCDNDYAWSLHCSLAMPIRDSIQCSYEAANKAGADLMYFLFDVNVREFPEWHSGTYDADKAREDQQNLKRFDWLLNSAEQIHWKELQERCTTRLAVLRYIDYYLDGGP